MDTFLLKTFRSFIAARSLEKRSRAYVRALQQKKLDATLVHAWDRSPFYRKLWRGAGITREQLPGIDMRRLPVVNKRMIMQNFGNVITDFGITQKSVEEFIQNDPTGKEWYHGKYVAMNTSGSSGVVGVFLYTKDFWARLMGVVAGRVMRLPLHYFLLGQVRLGFVGETSGHHAGISLIKAAPDFLHAASIDVDAPHEKIRQMLEAHKPNMLVGYASGIAEVADLQCKGELHIHPKVIVTSGEALSATREEIIKKAFGVRPINFYGATECLAMGASLFESGRLDIFDDILYLEAVDDAGSPVARGELGRVVITVLNNDIFPLIRYAIDDEVAIAPEDDTHPFTAMTAIAGRKMDRLTITLENGRTFQVHPMDMVGFFFPGLQQYQVVQKGPHQISVHAVFDGDQELARKRGFALIDEMLRSDGLTRDDIQVDIEFVNEILPNPKTGKTPIVVPLPGAAASAPAQS